MQILNFTCKNQILTAECHGRLVVAESRQHVYARFVLDAEWAGLNVTAIFTNDSESKPYAVQLTAEQVEIPPEVLLEGRLLVSLEGLGNSGRLRLPTAYMDKPIVVRRAGALVGLTPEEASPELWEQVLAAIGNLSELDTNDKSSLVAAINEAMKHMGDAEGMNSAISTLRKDIEDVKSVLYSNSNELDMSTLAHYTDYVVNNGYITWRGEIATQYNGKYTELIPVEMLGSITFHLPEGIGNISLCRYGEDQEFLNSVVMADGQVITNTIGCSYVAITTSLSNISETDFRNLFEIIAHPYVPAVSFVARPMVGSQIDDGESGQVLTSNGDGTTKWVNFADGENLFKGKTAVTFGDSITWYDSHNFGQYHTQAGTIAVGYQSYMRSKLGLTVNNQGISGAAMPEILAAVKAFDYTNVDYVTITTGANDYADVLRETETIGELSAVGSAFDETSLYGALQSAIEYILNQKNTIKIYLMTPIKGWWSTGVLPQAYAQAIIDVGALYSIPVHDWYGTSGINEINKSIYIGDITTSGTYLHPTNEGYARMADGFISFLKQG